MSSISPQEIKQEFMKSKMGIAGITILSILILTSIITIISIPVETFQEWNNPGNWISNPKVAIPIWVNIFMIEKIPEHKILDSPTIEKISRGEINLISHQFGLNYDYDDFPNDFIYEFTSEYSGSPLLQMSVIRPDGIKLDLITTSLPYSNQKTIHSERIFSTDDSIKKNLALQSEKFEFVFERLAAENIVFSKIQTNEPLKGNYIFSMDLYGIDSENKIPKSKLQYVYLR
jgi:peptide/nickel transport system permease protein